MYFAESLSFILLPFLGVFICRTAALHLFKMKTALLGVWLFFVWLMVPYPCLTQIKDLKRHLKKDTLHALKSLLTEAEKKSDALSCLCDLVYGHNGHGSGTHLQRGAATYVRWGRTTCPGNGTEMMYSGYAAGDWYVSGKGSAANYLCLPKNPDWAKYSDADEGASSAKIYGAEFNMHNHNIGEALHNQHVNYKVPCAVCQTKKRISVYMIPGKTQCFTGWNLEYRGYLMAQHPTQTASEYVCVDAHLETIGSSRNVNGRLFSPVEAACGALKCPPYVKKPRDHLCCLHKIRATKSMFQCLM